jgi:hypothetical protein
LRIASLDEKANNIGPLSGWVTALAATSHTIPLFVSLVNKKLATRFQIASFEPSQY